MNTEKLIRLLTWALLLLFGACNAALADNVTTQWEAGTSYIDAGATAADNTDGDITAKIVTTGVSAVNVAILGSYPVVYDVKDSAGNVADSAIRTVVVRDTQPPVIVLKGLQVLNVVQGTPPLGIELRAIATDSFARNCLVTVTGSVDTSKLGSVVLSYNAKDPSGNAAVTVIRTVNVIPPPDTTKPVITIKP